MGGNHGRDGGMTEKEEEKWRSLEHSRASTRVDRAHGSAPVLISITLTAQTYIKPPRKEIRNSLYSPELWKCIPTDVRSLITAWLDLIQRADVSHFEV